ncbi:hypothetical protein [Rhodobacter sp. SY28-1]|uniref:hypothetical protein n=1 Tax=Rhodobacter sp. SY28-1 TaxID=2562317 RepID=UPI0010C1112C|nr:hypothetical protein [Rhodobacter sp. SY28-1]
MLTHLARAWRIYSHEKARAALALRLGPHLARDIGIDSPHTPDTAHDRSSALPAGQPPIILHPAV